MAVYRLCRHNAHAAAFTTQQSRQKTFGMTKPRTAAPKADAHAAALLLASLLPPFLP
jgi:hypothetical protein